MNVQRSSKSKDADYARDLMKILIVKTSSMGDIIHTLPAVTDIFNNVTNAQIDWVLEKSFSEIPSWHKAVHKVIPISWRAWRRHIFLAIKNHDIANFLKTLRAEKYDVIVDAQGLLKSAFITLLSKGRTAGFDYSSAREPLAAFFYRKKYHVAKDQHAITRIRKLFSLAFNYPLKEQGTDYGLDKLSLSPNSIINSDDKYLVFVHGTTSVTKYWQEEKWINLAILAGHNGYKVKLPWGNKEEFERAERIKAACNNVIVLPKMSLTAIAHELQNSACVIAVDTGLGHLAAALDRPTISLYGNTKPKLIGTVGKIVYHIENCHDVQASEVWDIVRQLI